MVNISSSALPWHGLFRSSAHPFIRTHMTDFSGIWFQSEILWQTGTCSFCQPLRIISVVLWYYHLVLAARSWSYSYHHIPLHYPRLWWGNFLPECLWFWGCPSDRTVLQGSSRTSWNRQENWLWLTNLGISLVLPKFLVTLPPPPPKGEEPCSPLVIHLAF